ncbi:MAG: hypothetical protein R3B70_43890 [Polyangiaceae bacterium]
MMKKHPRIRTPWLTSALPALALLAGCPPSEPATSPDTAATAQVAIPPPAETGGPAGEAAPANSTSPAAPEVEAPKMEWAPADLTSSPGDSRLEPAAELVKKGDHANAKAALTKLIPELGTAASLDVRMAAHTLLGRTLVAQRDLKAAAEHYATVRGLWRDPKAATAELAALGGDDKAQLARTARALNAAAEALFFEAEQRRLLAEKEKMPAYTGSGTSESVLKYVNKQIAPWLKTRRALADEAEKAYTSVLRLEPIPPPAWVMASAERVGRMWSSLMSELRGVAIPDNWKGKGTIPGTDISREDVRNEFYSSLETAISPDIERARAAFQKCQDYSKKYRVQSDASRSCDDWLAKNPAPAATP